jgi:hypothetical protein
VYETATTGTGNYTRVQLPVGVYELTISVAGFTKYIRQGIQVQVAQTLRIDAGLQVGSATQSVTVTADASLLRSNSSDVTHNMTMERVNELPLYSLGKGGAGANGLRKPYAFLGMMPGATIDRANLGGMTDGLRVNGLPNHTYSTRVEGQEATTGGFPAAGSRAMTQGRGRICPCGIWASSASRCTATAKRALAESTGTWPVRKMLWRMRRR